MKLSKLSGHSSLATPGETEITMDSPLKRKREMCGMETEETSVRPKLNGMLGEHDPDAVVGDDERDKMHMETAVSDSGKIKSSSSTKDKANESSSPKHKASSNSSLKDKTSSSSSTKGNPKDKTSSSSSTKGNPKDKTSSSSSTKDKTSSSSSTKDKTSSSSSTKDKAKDKTKDKTSSSSSTKDKAKDKTSSSSSNKDKAKDKTGSSSSNKGKTKGKTSSSSSSEDKAKDRTSSNSSTKDHTGRKYATSGSPLPQELDRFDSESCVDSHQTQRQRLLASLSMDKGSNPGMEAASVSSARQRTGRIRFEDDLELWLHFDSTRDLNWCLHRINKRCQQKPDAQWMIQFVVDTCCPVDTSLLHNFSSTMETYKSVASVHQDYHVFEGRLVFLDMSFAGSISHQIVSCSCVAYGGALEAMVLHPKHRAGSHVLAIQFTVAQHLRTASRMLSEDKDDASATISIDASQNHLQLIVFGTHNLFVNIPLVESEHAEWSDASSAGQIFDAISDKLYLHCDQYAYRLQISAGDFKSMVQHVVKATPAPNATNYSSADQAKHVVGHLTLWTRDTVPKHSSMFGEVRANEHERILSMSSGGSVHGAVTVNLMKVFVPQLQTRAVAPCAISSAGPTSSDSCSSGPATSISTSTTTCAATITQEDERTGMRYERVWVPANADSSRHKVDPKDSALIRRAQGEFYLQDLAAFLEGIPANEMLRLCLPGGSMTSMFVERCPPQAAWTYEDRLRVVLQKRQGAVQFRAKAAVTVDDNDGSEELEEALDIDDLLSATHVVESGCPSVFSKVANRIKTEHISFGHGAFVIAPRAADNFQEDAIAETIADDVPTPNSYNNECVRKDVADIMRERQSFRSAGHNSMISEAPIWTESDWCCPFIGTLDRTYSGMMDAMFDRPTVMEQQCEAHMTRNRKMFEFTNQRRATAAEVTKLLNKQQSLD